MSKGNILPLGVVLGVALTPAASSAGEGWSQKVSTEVRVHEHSFDKLVASGQKCELSLELYFDAPEAQYGDKKNAVRNFYRFRARIRFADGQAVETRQFFNRTPGARMYMFRQDTTGEGCWSEKKHKVVKLDVERCRRKTCVVRPF